MASVNPLSRELVFKIVYYGPGLGGKTTTLEHIHATAKPDHRGKLVSLATPVDRTLYFDFLPMRLPPIRGMHVRLQLFTVPGQVYFNATRKLVLTGADGIVFVGDAQTARADANLESFDNLRDNLADQGRNLNDVPIVFQYNKYDLPDVLTVEELDKLLNKWNAPSLATSARTGLGVYEGLEKITHTVLASFETQMPESVRVAAAAAYDPNEEGLAAALRGASQGEDRPPTSGAIFNRIVSSRGGQGPIPPETGAEDAPPVDKSAARPAAMPVTSFPDTSDDGWGPKEKLATAPAADASILTKADAVRATTTRGPESRSGDAPRSRNRPSVLPPKPFAPVIPQAVPQRAPAPYAPAPPPNATTTAAKAPAPHTPAAHALTPPPNATTTAAKQPAPHVAQGAPAAPSNATVSAAKTAEAAADKAPSTERTIALPAKAPTPTPVRAEVVSSKSEPTKSPVEVVLAKPTPTPVKIEVAGTKPAPESAPAKPAPAEPKIEAAPATPQSMGAKAETTPAKPAPAESKIEAAPPTPQSMGTKVEAIPAKPEPTKVEEPQAKAAPEKPAAPAPTTSETKAPAPFARLDPTQLFSIADLLESELTPLAADDSQQPAKAPTMPPLSDAFLTPRAGSVPPGKAFGFESEPALRLDAPKPLEFEAPPPRTPSSAVALLRTYVPTPPMGMPQVKMVTAPGTIAVAVKGDSVPPPPPPPPARTTGGAQAFVDSKPKETPGATNLTPAPAGLSFANLWPESDRALVRDVEAAIADRRWSDAIHLADTLVTRVLTSTATLLGSSDPSRDATNMPLLLGIDGRRYLAFRSLVRAASGGITAGHHDALAAYAFAIEACMAKSSIR